MKDRKTQIIKKRDGRTAGGVSLTDETVKPYEEQLASLEAKVKEAKEQMTTVERMDDNTAEITAHNDINTDRIIKSVQQGFSKLAPKKFNCVGKCAYIVAKPVGDYYSGDYYRKPDGAVLRRRRDVTMPPSSVFMLHAQGICRLPCVPRNRC